MAIACLVAGVAAGGCGSDPAGLSCSELTPARAAELWRHASHRPTKGLILEGDAPATTLGFRMVACRTLVGLTRRQVRRVLGGQPSGDGGRIWEYQSGPDFGADNGS